MSEHVSSLILYIAIWIALLAGTLLTVLVAGIDLGPFNAVVALTIATIKATLVVLFFMQVKYGTRLTWLWASLGFIWLLLIFLIVSDYWTREWLPLHGWQEIHGPHK